MIDTNVLISAFILNSQYLSKYPGIRDEKDLPILASAIIEDVDVLITGDADFAPLVLNARRY